MLHHIHVYIQIQCQHPRGRGRIVASSKQGKVAQLLRFCLRKQRYSLVNPPSQRTPQAQLKKNEESEALNHDSLHRRNQIHFGLLLRGNRPVTPRNQSCQCEGQHCRFTDSALEHLGQGQDQDLFVEANF